MKRLVEVRQLVEVELDETKFDDEFMVEFRSAFYPFVSVDDHAKHLAGLHARGTAGNVTPFIEGYGDPKELGIWFSLKEVESEIIPDSEV